LLFFLPLLIFELFPIKESVIDTSSILTLSKMTLYSISLLDISQFSPIDVKGPIYEFVIILPFPIKAGPLIIEF